jgi:sortase A
MKRRISTIILVSILVIGLSLLLYPSISDWWNNTHSTHAVASYTQSVEKLDDEEIDAMWEAAQEYNSKLLDNESRYNMSEEEEEEYESLLNVDGDGVMSYITIPSISVTLPVYHGVEENILQIAAGHIPGSSLPVGGKGTHCVISGHRGLISAKLFSDLNLLTEGDVFILHTLNQELTYEVDQIRIVLPNEVEDLEIDPDKDYCTLVTCTPYGINTHRLLVRGHRIANLDGDAEVTADALQIDPLQVAPAVGAPIIMVLLGILMWRDHKQKKERKLKQAQEARKTAMSPGVPGEGETAADTARSAADIARAKAEMAKKPKKQSNLWKSKNTKEPKRKKIRGNPYRIDQ